MAFFIVVGTATAAYAHYVYERAQVWSDTTGKCVYNRSEISHGGGGGYYKVSNETYRRADTPWGSYDCLANWQLGPGYKRNKLHLLKYVGGSASHGSLSGWGLCAYSAWNYNATTKHNFSVHWTTGYPLCGNGSYGSHGHVQNRINRSNGKHDWVGGGMWSGAHSLPTSASTTTEAESAIPRPTWINIDGTLNPDGVPSTGIPVFSEEGEAICFIDLSEYLALGEDTPIDIVMDLDVPGQYELQQTIENSPDDGVLTEESVGVLVPASTICA